MARTQVLTLVAVAVLAGCGRREDPDRPDPATPPADLSDRQGALVDEIVFRQEPDPGKIVQLIEAGTHHAFVHGISNPAIFQQMRASRQTAYDESRGTSSELTFNPIGPTFANGDLNPFHVPAIREAMNRLVNRRHVAEEIFGGLAVPRVLPISTGFPDYARLAAEARTLELRYAHDPEAARAVITREMEALGARKVDGVWTYEGRPVEIRLLIRTEDERRRIGDYVANLLEDSGFRTRRLYRVADEASRIWIAGDPARGEWHVYTGGWVALVINRDQAAEFSFYYTPRGRPEPLWQAYTPTEELDTLADRLQRRDYGTWEERQAMMARGLELGLQDSVRIFLVDQLNVWPRHRDLEMAVDLAAGVSGSSLWPYTIRFRDRVGGRVVFGTPQILVEPWNPVAGTNWVFDSMIMRGLTDAPFLPDPYTGLFLPQRVASAELTVQEGVSVLRTHDWLTVETVPEIVVHPDAWLVWDPPTASFVSVGERHPEGLTARTRIRVRYEDGFLERTWHDGSQVSLADLVLPWILAFERTHEQSPLFDRAEVPSFEVYLRHFRGWRIVSRDPLEIEAFSDQIFPDAEWIVAARTPAGSPWHALALGILAEQAGELAFSSDKADQQQVEWTNYIAGPSLRVLDRHLESARARNLVPFGEALAPFLREGEAEARYAALAEWRRARGHFWVNDGPFYLHSVHPVERNVVIRRFEGFQDPSDKWLRFSDPMIPQVEIAGPLMVPADAEATFTVDIRFGGAPYPADDLEAVDYLLFDPEGRLVRRRAADATGPGTWEVRLDPEDIAALGQGACRLEVAVSSRRVAMPTFASHTFATAP